MTQTRSKYVAALILGVASVATLSIGVSSVVVAQDKEKSQRKVSKAAAKPLKAAQDAIEAKNYPEALNKLKEVEGLSGLTPYDQHVLNELSGSAYLLTRNFPEAAKALEAGLSSGFLEAADQAKRLNALAQVNYEIKNYDKAIEFGTRSLKEGTADEAMYTRVGQAYYIKGDYKGAVKFIDSYIDAQVQAGKTPKEEPLQLIVSSCVKLDDAKCTTRALERIVEYYPKPEYWQNLLYFMFQAQSTSAEKSVLNVYRLASEVDVLKSPEDYTEMAQLAIEQGSPGEAVRALEKGFSKGVFTEQRDKERNQRLLESAKKQAATDQASLTKIEKDTATAKTGDKDVGLGLAYLSYEQYPKAVEALNRGLTKGGVRNEPEARLLLGIAQLKAGNKDEATKTFQQVKGNATLERLANLWSLHAKQAPARSASAAGTK